jgi:hypothetical protein
MQSYIRRLDESLDGLRALMKSALPLLISISASKVLLASSVWGSWSDLECHQLEFASHRAVGCFNLLALISLLVIIVKFFYLKKRLTISTL